jgi:hypothetical protein
MCRADRNEILWGPNRTDVEKIGGKGPLLRSISVETGIVWRMRCFAVPHTRYDSHEALRDIPLAIGKGGGYADADADADAGE